MFNLDDQLMSKTRKQIVRMLTLRVNKYSAAHNFVWDHSGHHIDDMDKLTAAEYRKAEKDRDIAADWIAAAKPLFSASYWDELVMESGSTLDEWGSE